jgi:uncharacterized protein YdhG (YjbR/CyaY superfamily)
MKPPSSSAKSSAKHHSTQVREYIAALPADARRHIQGMRAAIRVAAPGVVEAFGYGMPAFAIDGKPFIWYGAWKRHSSLYPVSRETLRAFAADVKDYKTSGKGTIQFPYGEALPTGLVKRLVKARIAEVRKKNST